MAKSRQNDATPGTAGRAERRRFRRTTTILRARILVKDQCLESLVLDVSINGVKVKLGERVDVGTPVTLVLAGSVHFGGRIAWQRDLVHGIEFANQPETVATIMAGLLPEDHLVCGHA